VTADLILHMRACHLRRHRFFSGLNTEEMRQVCIKSSEVFYMEGDALVQVGSTAQSAFFLTRGTVEIEARRPGEDPTFLVSPAWFGDLSLFNRDTGIVRTATVRAVDATSAIEVRQDVIADMSTKFPHMSKLYEEFVKEAEKDRSAFLNGGLKADAVEEEAAYKNMGIFKRLMFMLGKRDQGVQRRVGSGKTTGQRSRANTTTFAGDPVLKEIRESGFMDHDGLDSSDSDSAQYAPDNIAVIEPGNEPGNLSPGSTQSDR
jgi:CRP-like cAMP-binding protein